MKYLKMILLAIFDPISSLVSKVFPEKAYKIASKNILIQVLIALVITFLFLFIARWI